ncbi:unnamed protein product [Cylindrotheca closterium]|uniref:G2/mitotic-specific cyclin-B3 n=1 Tax=Cylindrotheca closterium TaxID=2856 RepID=A0AAD2FV77_9STRA|nr:unnamed protein product [Cylindrotheca closterium]
MAGNAATRPVTRSSAQNATGASRRALGDVSNQASTSNNELANKSTRRSQRLSSSANQSQSRPEDETTTSVAAPRRSRRLSNAASNEDTSTQNATATATRSEPSNKRSRRTSSRGAKRSRSLNSDSSGPARKSRRNSAPRNGSRGEPTVRRQLCADIINTGHVLQRHPFDASKYVAGVSVHDNDKSDDPQEAHEYVTDIFQRLFDSESKSSPRPFINSQPALNTLMREILIDWLVEVHMKFRLLPETLYLSVNILDRYLNKETVPRRKLQLVGVTSLLLACKYEEIYPPEVKDCVYITDRAYTRQDVLDMEAHIVMTLEFRLSVSTGYPFLKRYLDIMKASSTAKNLASFYMERTLQEHESLQFRPSVLAAAAVSLAMSNPDIVEFAENDDEGHQPGIPKKLIRYTGFSICEIRDAASLMERTVPETTSTNARRTLAAVKRKYESDRYDCVSTAFTPPLVEHLENV